METIDLYDGDRKRTNVTITRGEPIPENFYMFAVAIWVVTPDGKLLTTLRSKDKSIMPNLWENTAGCLMVGEDSLEGAKRELFEETGIVATDDELERIMELKYPSYLFDVYLLKKDININDIVLQEGETEDVKLVTLTEFDEMIKKDIVASTVAERFYQCLDILKDATTVETIDLYDKNRTRTGATLVRGEPIPESCYSLSVSIWVVTPNGKILTTLRSKEKKHSPNLWENTEGALKVSENSIDGAIRELFEETGIVATKDELTKIKELNFPSRFFDVYLLKKDININDIVLQQGETVDAKLVSFLEFEDMIKNNLVSPSVGKRFYKSIDILKNAYLEV